MKSRDQRAPVPNAERQSSMIVDAERVVRSRRDARKAEVRERGGPRRRPAPPENGRGICRCVQRQRAIRAHGGGLVTVGAGDADAPEPPVACLAQSTDERRPPATHARDAAVSRRAGVAVVTGRPFVHGGATAAHAAVAALSCRAGVSVVAGRPVRGRAGRWIAGAGEARLERADRAAAVPVAPVAVVTLLTRIPMAVAAEPSPVSDRHRCRARPPTNPARCDR